MEERLQKFARLVECGSFTRASEELHISQPALSLSIAKLERELRTPLLVRTSRNFQLTEAGRLAYAAAKELHTATNNLRLKLAELANEELAVSVGMIDSVASYLLRDNSALANLERQAHISIDVHNSRHLQERVLRGQLDMAFIVDQPLLTHPNLETTPLGSEPLVVVCHPADRATAERGLQRGVLRPFISYDQPSISHNIVLQALNAQGITPVPAFYSTSPDVMLRLVLLQKGAAALPYLQVEPLLQQQGLSLPKYRRDTLVIRRPIACIQRKGKAAPAPLAQLREEVQRALQTPLF